MINEERDYLWTGEVKDLTGPIEYMKDKKSSFNGFDWCKFSTTKKPVNWRFLYQSMNTVRGCSWRESTDVKLLSGHEQKPEQSLKGRDQSKPVLKYAEVRGFAQSWEKLQSYLLSKHKVGPMYVTIERIIEVGSTNNGLALKRIDAIVTFLTTDAANVCIVNIIPVEYKYILSYNIPVTTPIHIATTLTSLLEIYGAIASRPDCFIDNANLKETLNNHTYKCAVHFPVLLFNIKDGALLTEKFRDLLKLIRIENMGCTDDGYYVVKSPLLNLK